VQDAGIGCASGQFLGPSGSCYAIDTTPASAADALAACSAHGVGWNVAQINTASDNAFLTGLLNCAPAWIDGNQSALGNWAAGEPQAGGTDAYIDELGSWHIALDGTPRAVVCQGPAAATTKTALAQVTGLSACTSGADQYYFRGASYAPDAVQLCPKACQDVATVPNARVDVEIPCAPPSPPARLTTVDGLYYTAQCGTAPDYAGSNIWDFFYYDALTPGDSRVDFAVRAAPTIAELGANDFISIGSAHAVPTDTQRCQVNPPACPIDIYQALRAPAQQQKVLELQITLVPGTSGEAPVLKDWQVRYSCPPSD
jgi:hypothetical protein